MQKKRNMVQKKSGYWEEKNEIITSLIGVLDGVDPGVVEGAEDLNEGVLIGAESSHCIVQLFGKVLVQRRHACNYSVLKFSTELTF